MAERYEIDGSHVQDELRGTDRLVPVRVIDLHSKPSLVYWQERFDVGSQTPASMGAYLALQAVLIESIVQDPRVAGMQYEQDVNAAGQLIDVFEIFVLSTSGNSTSSFTQYYSDLSLEVVDPLISAQVALLDAIEAL